ncbi:MAG: hypothetical protein ACLFPV_15810, partial [Spirochaetaceae bacterium]
RGGWVRVRRLSRGLVLVRSWMFVRGRVFGPRCAPGEQQEHEKENGCKGGGEAPSIIAPFRGHTLL